jgi:nicotinamidase-related amidase
VVSYRKKTLHATGIPRQVADSLTAQRGQLHVFPTLQPCRTALLVIDMQEVFLSEANRHLPFFCPGGRQLVRPINRLAAALRAQGGSVIFITSDVGADALDSWRVMYGKFIPTGPLRDGIQRALTVDAGRWGDAYDPKQCAHGSARRHLS